MGDGVKDYEAALEAIAEATYPGIYDTPGVLQACREAFALGRASVGRRDCEKGNHCLCVQLVDGPRCCCCGKGADDQRASVSGERDGEPCSCGFTTLAPDENMKFHDKTHTREWCEQLSAPPTDRNAGRDHVTVRRLASYAARFRPQGWRVGQSVFNMLAEFFPEAVEPLRGTNIDPFHRDGVVEVFVDAVEAALKGGGE